MLTPRADLRLKCLMSMIRSKRWSRKNKLSPWKRYFHNFNQNLRGRCKGRYSYLMRSVNFLEMASSCFTSSLYQCMKDIKIRASYCINNHSLMVQSIISLVIRWLFMKKMENFLNFKILKNNCGMICLWNGSAQKIFSQILRSFL